MSGYVRVRTFLAAGSVVVFLGIAAAATCAESPGDKSKPPADGAIALVARGSSASGSSAAASQSSTPPTTVIATPRSAPELVQAALREEVEPSGGNREALLREAVKQDPDCAAARWQSGYVRMGKQWLSTDQVEQKHAADGRLAEYARLREKQSGTPEGELALARWCRNNDLPEQARYHWLSLLQFLPNHEEALKALGVRWRNGSLVSLEQSAQQKKEQLQSGKRARSGVSETRSALQSTIAKWEREAAQEGAELGVLIRNDMADRLSDRSLQLVTTILAERSRKPKASDALRTVNLAWIDFLKGQPSNARYLVAIAMWHPLEAVRNAAGDAMKDLPKESYVPLLLACAKFPVEFSFALSGLGATFTFDSSGYEGDSHVEHTAGFQRSNEGGLEGPPERGEDPPQLRGRVNEAEVQGRVREAQFQYYLLLMQAVGNWQRLMVDNAAKIGRQVGQYNAYADENNKRVTDALSRATGVNLATDPRSYQRWWRDYWYDYYEIEKPREKEGERPVYTRYSGSSFSYQNPLAGCMITAHSCFRGSTPVWTLTGPVPIQSIRAGDRVLSQDPITGELAYKTVLKVTTADPTPMVRIRLGTEEILATRGHPFWVVGQQWRMAKQLEVGMRLHTPGGAVRIDDVRPVPLAETADGYSYNLVVDDFHTYFVGQHKALVHHLTMLSILDGGAAGVPGMTGGR